MGAVAPQITSLTIVYSTVNSGPDQRNIKALHHWPLYGELTGDRWISTQMASDAENISIWWRHHGLQHAIPHHFDDVKYGQEHP